MTDFITVQMSSIDLIYRARERDILSVQELLEKGADPNIKSLFRLTPLHVALDDESVYMPKLLILYGAVM